LENLDLGFFHCSIHFTDPLFLKKLYIEKRACKITPDAGTLRVIADVTDPDAIQTILAHLRQRAPPDAVHRQRPGQGPQNDLFAAS
jgi:hypothetical protein